MKYEKIIYAISAIIIIAAAIMNILHIPFGNTLFVVGVLAMLVFQNRHIKKLKERVSELEDENKNRSSGG